MRHLLWSAFLRGTTYSALYEYKNFKPEDFQYSVFEEIRCELVNLLFILLSMSSR